MASTKIQNLPLKAPIGAMKIPTGGFGDYSITVSSIGDFIIDTFNLATKDYVDTLLVEKEDRIDTTGVFLTPVSQNSSVPDTTNDVIDEVAQALLNRIEYVKDNFSAAPSHNELTGRSASGAHPSTSISHKSGTVYTYLSNVESDINTINNVTIPTINQSIGLKQDQITTTGTLTGTPEETGINSVSHTGINSALQGLLNRILFNKNHSNLTNRSDENSHPSSAISYGLINQKKVNDGVETIQDLLNIQNPFDGMRVYVKSYHSPNFSLNNPFVGGGERVYRSSLSNVNNDGTVINGWVLISPKWTFEEWGAKSDDPTFDNSVPIQKALNFVQQETNAKISSEQDGATYYIANPLVLTGTIPYVPNGNLLNIDFTGIKLAPSTDNLTMLVVNRNHTKITRLFITNPLSKNNVTGVLFGSTTPEIKGGTCFSTIEYYTCEYIKTAFKAQPTRTDSNGSTAGAYYNEIINPVVMNTEIGFHFAGNDLALNNQNTRYNVFNPRQIGGDYMFKLECVETLKVFGGSAEFVGVSTGSGAVIYQTQKYPNHVFENNNNSFYGLVAEACNRLYENNSWTLSLIGCVNINPEKPSISGSSGRVITEISGRVQATSDVAENEPIVSALSSVHNKQIYMRVTDVGDCQLWADSVINIPQDINMFNANLSNAVTTSNSRVFTPNVTSKTSDLVLASNNGDSSAIVLNTSSSGCLFWNTSGTQTVFGGMTALRPSDDNLADLGSASNRWKNVYAGNGAIVTSDERYKQQFRSLSDAEKSAAKEIKESICLYKFNDMVETKGDGARWHVGVKAQQIVQIMTDHGLDWRQYGFVCHDEWEATPDFTITVEPEELDNDGNIIKPAVLKTVKGVEAGDRYSVRYDELTMFILSSI
ncbi:tailspike protein I [Acinetobacter phage TaPaz]|nr:tailspike protein I [Acinetobacter phage TaPaz]